MTKSTRTYQRIPPKNQNNRYCIRVLCEDENNWHPCGAPLEYENISNIPKAHYAYFIRIMSLVKQISGLNVEILLNAGKLDELIDLFDKQIPSNEDEYKPLFNDVFNFKESYFSIKNYLLNKLDNFKNNSRLRTISTSLKMETNLNINRIDFFRLNRCVLSSGRVLWLCDEHSQKENVQILNETENVSIANFQNDEFHSILFDELKKLDDH